jgi:hypothetical protein
VVEVVAGSLLMLLIHLLMGLFLVVVPVELLILVEIRGMQVAAVVEVEVASTIQ